MKDGAFHFLSLRMACSNFVCKNTWIASPATINTANRYIELMLQAQLIPSIPELQETVWVETVVSLAAV